MQTKRRNIFRTYHGKSKRTGGGEFGGAYYDGGDGFLLMPTVVSMVFPVSLFIS